MRVAIKLQELQKKKAKLKSKLQSMQKKEKTLEESIKIFEEKLAIQELETRAKGSSRCAGYLGYLASFPKNKPIPKECLICPKVLDCVMKTSAR